MISPRQKLGPISFRNKALQDILRSSKEAIAVLSVETVNHPIHNTKIIFLLSDGTRRAHFYNRVDITSFIPLDLNLPNNINDVITLLNTAHSCDFNSDDLELVKGDLITKPNSLGYKGIIPSQGTDHAYIANGYIGRIKLSNGQEWSQAWSDEYWFDFLKQHGICLIATGDILMCWNLTRWQNTTNQKIEIEIDNTSSDTEIDGMEVLEPQENKSIEKSDLTNIDIGVGMTSFYKKVKFVLAPNKTFTQEQIMALYNYHNVDRSDVTIYNDYDTPHREDVNFDFYLNGDLITTAIIMEETDLDNVVSALNSWVSNKNLGQYIVFNAVVDRLRFCLGVNFTPASGFILLKIVARYTTNPNEDQNIFRWDPVIIEGNSKIFNIALYDPFDVDHNGTGLG